MHFLFTQPSLKIQQPSVLDLQHFSLYVSSLSNLIQRLQPTVLSLCPQQSSLPPATGQFCPSQVSLAFPYILYCSVLPWTQQSELLWNIPFPPFPLYGWCHVCLSLLPVCFNTLASIKAYILNTISATAQDRPFLLLESGSFHVFISKTEFSSAGTNHFVHVLHCWVRSPRSWIGLSGATRHSLIAGFSLDIPTSKR